MKRFPVSRRALLRRLGVGAAALPLLEATRARGQSDGAPRRLIVMSKGGGTIPDQFWPAGGDGTSLAGMTFGPVVKSLELHRPYLNFLGGLTIACYKGPGDGHILYGSLLTGNGVLAQNNNPAKVASVDWLIGQEIAKRVGTPFPTLAVSVLEGRELGLSQLSWRGAGQPNTAEYDPYKLFDKVFAGRTLSGTSVDLQRLRAENRSLLDFVGRRLESFGKTLGADDRQKIDAHLTAVRAVEKQLAVTLPASCAAPDVPGATTGGARLAPKLGTNVPALAKVMIDIVIAAMRCDLTRVATISLTDTFGDNVRFEWLGTNRGYHAIKHKNGQNFDSWVEDEQKAEPWLMSQFAYLLAQMSAVKEGAATMLDSSMAFWCDSLSNGTNHSFRGMPWILAGKAGGYFRTGRLLRYGGWASASDQYWKATNYIAHNGLLVSLANAMGVPMPSVGDPAFGVGELPGLRA
jgi:hypothetical protein